MESRMYVVRGLAISLRHISAAAEPPGAMRTSRKRRSRRVR